MLQTKDDAARALVLVNRAIEMTEKKKALLIELRAAIVRESGTFPRPMGVPRDA